MKIYNKLVRNNIPTIIEKDNKKAITRILDDQEYLFELNEKLKEELTEYLESGSIEELADIGEVMNAILDFKKVSIEEFQAIRNEKKETRGGFNKRIFLEKVIDEKK